MKMARVVADAGARSAQVVLYSPAAASREPTAKQFLTRQLAVKLPPDRKIEEIAARYNLTLDQVIGYSPNTYLLTANDQSPLASLTAANAIYEAEGAEFATPMIARHFALRDTTPNDPRFPEQWHLRNLGPPHQVPPVTGAVAGNDVNIVSAWDSYRGAGIKIAIVDSDVDWQHPDLAPNYRFDIDTNLVSAALTDAAPACGAFHGSACAGLAAARGYNTPTPIGVVGSAFDASIVAVRLFPPSGFQSDAQIASALNHMATASSANRVDISSNSWGPDDGDPAHYFTTFGPLSRAALLNGINNGRAGKGIIYVWAHGNGHCALNGPEHGNADGYASSQYTIAVAASRADGRRSDYSEKGSAILINAPSSGDSGNCALQRNVLTTFLSLAHYEACNFNQEEYQLFGGTSAATPIAAGCIALMLQANPNLTWRDVQHLLVQTATKNDYPADLGWAQNAAGFYYHHGYGFGRINASAAVTAAQTWNLVPTRATTLTASETTSVAIPDNNPTGITRTRSVFGPANFIAEHVEATVSLTHPKRGDLRITLTSPLGTVSTLNEPNGITGANLNNWVFTSVVNWGENPSGTWSLKVVDTVSGNSGTLTSWSLNVYGYSKYSINCGGSIVESFASDIYFSGGFRFPTGIPSMSQEFPIPHPKPFTSQHA